MGETKQFTKATWSIMEQLLEVESIEEALTGSLDIVMKAINGEVGAIWLLDEKKNMLRPMFYYGSVNLEGITVENGRLFQTWAAESFPWGTMTVNVVGCFLIGLLSGMSLGGQISPTTKLVLVTGFCGGFTTFSTFMNENLLLGRDGAFLSAVLYTLASLVLGLIAVVIGYQLVK